MTHAGTLDFARHLSAKRIIARDLAPDLSASGPQLAALNLRKLWEFTDLSAADFADEVARFYRLPRLSLAELVTASPLVDKFSSRFLREAGIFPHRTPDGLVKLAVFDPGDDAALRAAEIVLGSPPAVEVGSFEDIATALAEHQEPEAPAESDGLPDQRNGGADEDIDILRDIASGAPVVRAVSDLLDSAVELRASDIHIEPFRSGMSVRMRIDGLLRVVASPAVPPAALISRIKIMAALNIAERRLPQDGAARLRVGGSELDIRVATMPTQHGESAVIRLLPRDRGVLEMSKLGLSHADEDRFARLLALPHGMIIVTGPTGSGKTTTLATMLSVLNQTTRKILTIEDPVEYEIRGINQSQVKPSIGLTFANVLRAFVRQDPDVIMVGEVRDPETAHLAVHAGLTGHLVLTTLHTENAATAVPRLLDLQVQGFLLKSTLRAVIAQRLVRVLCDRCKTRRALSAADLESDPRHVALGFKAGETLWKPAGCERCGGSGYRGRIGAFEVLETGEEIRRLIGDGADANAIDLAARNAGMTTMVEDAVAKCRAGITSIAEVLRVTTVR
jgi:general secretion pathway protein E